MAGTTHSVCESTSESHLRIRSPKIQHFRAPNGVNVMPLTPLRRLLSQPMSPMGNSFVPTISGSWQQNSQDNSAWLFDRNSLRSHFLSRHGCQEQPRPGEKTHDNRTSLLAALTGIRHTIHSSHLPTRCNELGPGRHDVFSGPHPDGKPCRSARRKRAKPWNRSSIQQGGPGSAGYDSRRHGSQRRELGCNVIAPVIAVACLGVAGWHFKSGRGYMGWGVSGVALMVISGLGRMAEGFITQAQGIN
jgi:hypothetical protein